MLEESCKLSFAVVRDIFDHGFSRVPVYARERQHVVGLLFVKDLIFVDPEDEVPLAEYLRVFERSIELVDGNARCRERRLRMSPARRRHAVDRDELVVAAQRHDVGATGLGDQPRVSPRDERRVQLDLGPGTASDRDLTRRREPDEGARARELGHQRERRSRQLSKHTSTQAASDATGAGGRKA